MTKDEMTVMARLLAERDEVVLFKLQLRVQVERMNVVDLEVIRHSTGLAGRLEP